MAGDALRVIECLFAFLELRPLETLSSSGNRSSIFHSSRTGVAQRRLGCHWRARDDGCQPGTFAVTQCRRRCFADVAMNLGKLAPSL